jgi:uncharacterized membrane protein (DUF373 family)
VFDQFVNMAKKALVIVVVLMILVVVVVIVVALVGTIYDLLFDPTPFNWEKTDFLNFFSYLLLVVIGLELLDTVYVLLKEARIHVETVLLVAVTAVARELIVYNYEGAQGATLAGMAAVMAGIAVAYYVVRRAEWGKKAPEAEAPSPSSSASPEGEARSPSPIPNDMKLF